jgi:hypothetical protein
MEMNPAIKRLGYHNCHTIITLFLHCCYTIITLLLHSRCAVVQLLSHCCYTVVTLLLLNRMMPGDESSEEATQVT